MGAVGRAQMHGSYGNARALQANLTFLAFHELVSSHASASLLGDLLGVGLIGYNT